MRFVGGMALLLAGLIVVNTIFSYQSKYIDSAFMTTLRFQIMLLPLFVGANLLIGYGIKFSVQGIGNLGYVLTSAKVAEILISLLMGYLFMQEVPSLRAWLGFGIVLVGMIVAKL